MDAIDKSGLRSMVSVVGGAVIGLGFFLWLAGWRVIDPHEIGWLMQLHDWQQHFLGWHVFRHEVWRLPPGQMINEFYPVGTSIAYTDSVPLAALLLKPLAPILPDPFQYLGGWLMICFVLQGAAGAALIGCWTERTALRLAGALLLVLSPVLLDRIGHVALTSHWLLLLALWLYFRPWRGVAPRIGWWTLLVFLAAAIQPYLWVMVVVLSIAAAARYAIADRAYRPRDVLLHVAAMVVVSTLASWALGWLLVSSQADRSAGGLGFYSMNLLGFFASNGWAALGPSIPVFEGQTYEGFNYPGAGMFGVMAIAALTLAARRPARSTAIAAAPLLVACTLLAIASLSPTVTFGRHVTAEIALPDRLQAWYATFRSTGRFFWPAGYVLAAGAIGVIVARWPPLAALLMLTAAAGVQAYDLRSRYVNDRAVRSNPAWYMWNDPTRDSYWSAIGRSHRHVLVLPPEACGPEPAPFAPLMYFAGRYGLTINAGSAARQNASALAAACAKDMAEVGNGRLRLDTIYVTGNPDQLRASAAPIQLICHPLAGAMGCVVESHGDHPPR